MGALLEFRKGSHSNDGPRSAPVTSSAAAADFVRSSARRLEGLSGREFRREVDRLLEGLHDADAIGFHDAKLMLQAEARFGAYFAAAAGPVLGADLTWGDGEQAFAEWAARAHASWARIAEEYAKLELAAIGPDSPYVARLLALALARQGDAVKWRSIAGRVTGDHSLLHRVFRLAQSAGIALAVTPILRDGTVVKASPRSLYLRALLFDACCAGTMSRPALEIADAWLLAWSASLGACAEAPADAGAPHVDLDGTDGLEASPARPRPGILFVTGLATLRERLGELRREFRDGRNPPGIVAFGPSGWEHSIEALCRLDEILDYWLGAGGAREGRLRPEAEFEADCYVGIGEIAGRGPLASGSGLENPGGAGQALELAGGVTAGGTRLDRHADFGISRERIGRRARIVDLSTHGLGLLVPRWDDGHPVLGDLMGVRIGGEMLVGRVVRRYAQPGTDQLRVGLRLLARRSSGVALRAVSPEATRAAKESTALFVPGDDPTGREDAIVLSRQAFLPDADYEMAVAGRTYTVRALRDEASGRGWICVRFRALGSLPEAA